MNERQIEGIQVVIDKINKLDELSTDPISNEDARSIAGILRLLFTGDGGLFFKALKWCDIKRFRIKAPKELTQEFSPHEINFLFVGGGTIKGTMLRDFVIINNIIKVRKSKKESKKPPTIACSLEEYLNACSIKIGGKSYRREWLIKEFANKYGESHFDETNLNKSILKVHRNFKLVGIDPLSYEMVSVAQCFVKNSHTQHILKKMKEIVKKYETSI